MQDHNSGSAQDRPAQQSPTDPHRLAASDIGNSRGSALPPLTSAANDTAETLARLLAEAQRMDEPSHSDVMVSPPPELPETATIAPPVAADAPTEPAACTTGADAAGKPARRGGLGPRWSYIITRGLIITVVWAFFTYAFDPLLRFAAIRSAQTAAGAKVDIEVFRTGFFPPAVTVAGVEVASSRTPGRNLFEFADMSGNVDGLALLKGSYVFNEATITGLTWNTPRDDDGQLEKKIDEDEEDSGSSMLDDLKAMGKDWAQDIIERAKLEYDPRHLESVRMAESLEREWKRELDGFEDRISGVKTEYKALEDLFKLAKHGKPLENIDKYQRLLQDGQQLIVDVDNIRQRLGELPPRAQSDLQDLNEARKRDQAEIRRKAEELFGDSENLSEFLMGPVLHHRVQQALAWLEWANGRVDEFSGGDEAKKLRGEDILFKREFELPKYLVRLVNLNGGGRIGDEDITIEGTVSDITNDPKLHGRPVVMRLTGQGSADVQVKTVIDRTTEVARNEVEVDYTIPRRTVTQLGGDDSLLLDVQADSTKWSLNLRTVGTELTGQVLMTQDPVVITPTLTGSNDERLQRILQSSLSYVRDIEAVVHLSGTIRKPQWKLETNLGPAISDGVRSGLRNEITIQKDALLAKLDARVNEKRTELVENFRGRYGTLLAQLDAHKSEIHAILGGLPIDPSMLANGLLNPELLKKVDPKLLEKMRSAVPQGIDLQQLPELGTAALQIPKLDPATAARQVLDPRRLGVNPQQSGGVGEPVILSNGQIDPSRLINGVLGAAGATGTGLPSSGTTTAGGILGPAPIQPASGTVTVGGLINGIINGPRAATSTPRILDGSAGGTAAERTGSQTGSSVPAQVGTAQAPASDSTATGTAGQGGTTDQTQPAPKKPLNRLLDASGLFRR